MKPTRSNLTRTDVWILGAPALAIVATTAFMLAGAGPDWVRAVWLAAVIWTVAASFVQALWKGLRRGDWSAFSCEALAPDDEQFDWETKTGRYAFVRIQARNEELMSEGERLLEGHHHVDSRT